MERKEFSAPYGVECTGHFVSESIITVKKLEKHFGGVMAVASLSFDVHHGEVLGLMGPNGAGKSTTFNLIAGEYRPNAGEIIYCGEDITGHRPYHACHIGIARTYQIPQPFPRLSVLLNVIVGARFGNGLKLSAAERVAWELLELVELEDKGNEPAMDLSIVSLKKLELARALASNPKLLLLDEVAAGSTEAEIPGILAIINEIRKMGKTVILVEHVMKVLMKAVDRLIVMDKGMKIAEGLPDDVIRDKQVVNAYFGESVET